MADVHDDAIPLLIWFMMFWISGIENRTENLKKLREISDSSIAVIKQFQKLRTLTLMIFLKLRV